MRLGFEIELILKQGTQFCNVAVNIKWDNAYVALSTVTDKYLFTKK